MVLGETETANQRSQENLKFCATFSECALIGGNLSRREKEWNKHGKFKVSTLDIQIKQSGFTPLRYPILKFPAWVIKGLSFKDD